MFKKILMSFLIGLFFAGKVIAQGVDYYLPYPGILPDHPLYWLKMVRDRVGLVLTTGETAKAEKLLLYADKRLGAAWALIEGNKVTLGASTLTKAEKYLEEAWNKGKNLPLQPKLSKAVKKHLEVLTGLKEKSGDYGDLVEGMIAKLETINDQAQPETGQVKILVSFGDRAIEETPVEAATALEALEKVSADQGWEIQIKEYDFGKLVEAVNGYKNNPKKAWIYSVNGQAGDKAAGRYNLSSGDKVEWKYEAVKP